MAFRIFFRHRFAGDSGAVRRELRDRVAPGLERPTSTSIIALLADKIKDKAKAAEIAETPVKFSQIYNPELGVVDRCTICHVGMDNPQMDGAKNPFKVHPGQLLASHPFQKLGCTICHRGPGACHDPRRRARQCAALGPAAVDRRIHSGDVHQMPSRRRDPPSARTDARQAFLHDLGCIGLPSSGRSPEEENRRGPRGASVEGWSKVSRKWLVKWLMNPRGYLPKAKMPNFHLHPQEANALAAYVMTFKDKAIDALPNMKGDHDAGAIIFRESQCIICHVTREDSQGNGVGGVIGPDLRKVGNKVNVRWLTTFLKNPHAFYPHTKMPRFHFSDQAATDRDAVCDRRVDRR